MICVLMAALLLTSMGTAMAEEKLHHAEVELYSRGGLPKESLASISKTAGSAFEKYMLKQLEEQAETIDVSAYRMTQPEFHEAYQRLLNVHPELFFVNGGYRYTGGTYVESVLPYYAYAGSELKRMQKIYQDGVSAIVDYARGASTDVGRMLRANDYMCANFEYDLNYSIYSPELLFENKTGVCQAYMLAYRAVLNELGITNITVSSDEINHTWNLVYLDGSWYHIDVTWNDPISDVPLRAFHTNFLLSDEGITATGHAGWDDGWEDVVAADNKKYDDYFWINLNQAAPMQGDIVYYVVSDGNKRHVYAYDLTSGKADKIYTYSYGYGVYYMDFNPIWINDQTLYYAVRDSLYSVPLTGGESRLVYSTGNSSQWIWYPFQSGAQIRMYVAQTPNGGGNIHTYPSNLKYELTLDHSVLQMEIGDKSQLEAILTPAQDVSVLTWSSDNQKIATVSSAGKVSAVSAGVTDIHVSYDEKTKASCTVIVNAKDKLSLPEDIETVREEAFAGIVSGMVVLPEGITTIGARAFAGNENLLLVNLPSSLASIAADAFEGCTNVTLLCAAGSAGEAYAVAQQIPYVILP